MRYDNNPNDIRICYIDSETVTPLFVACHHRRKEMIKLLVNYGADINIKNDKGETAFFSNCKYECDIDMACLLIKYKANPFINDNENNSALHIYSKYLNTYKNYNDKYVMLEYLLELGYNINEKDKNGKTPLMKLCYHDNASVVYFFMQHGSNIYMKDNNGNTALSIAQSLHNYRVVNYLVEHGALWKFYNFSKNNK